MFNHIKNAIVYKAELPTAAQLIKHLAELPYSPIGETMIDNASFVANRTSNELVTEFQGGYSFSLRYDEKILPKSIVREKANERIKAVEQAAGHRLKKIERVAIAEQVMVDLARTALVKTAIITAFYNTTDNLLIVAVGSKNLANILVSRLIHVVGSVKTSTIHISDIKNGLTTRLKAFLQGNPDAFEGFEVGASAALKNHSQKVSYSLADIGVASQGLLEAMEKGFVVERLALAHSGVEFKLTADFHFKAVSFANDEDERDDAEERDDVFMWRQDAAAQTLMFSSALNQLCDLLGYKPEEEQPAETEQA